MNPFRTLILAALVCAALAPAAAHAQLAGPSRLSPDGLFERGSVMDRTLAPRDFEPPALPRAYPAYGARILPRDFPSLTETRQRSAQYLLEERKRELQNIRHREKHNTEEAREAAERRFEHPGSIREPAWEREERRYEAARHVDTLRTERYLQVRLDPSLDKQLSPRDRAYLAIYARERYDDGFRDQNLTRLVEVEARRLVLRPYHGLRGEER